MPSTTPSNAPTDIQIVELASITQDPSWPIDPALVASFRASISRGGPPLLDLSLNRLRRADGSVGLEIIDGMHRLEALRQEGVVAHTANVREYTTHDAFYARIATSIGKPNDLFRQRAERALREGFVRDVAAHLEGVTLFQRGLTEDGAIIPLPRRQPLPTDPLLALGTIVWIHFAAKPEVTEDWEGYVLDWLSDIAERLGKTPEWLRDEILDISALVGEDMPGKRSTERVRLLLAIPDEGILRLVLARLKNEPKLATTDLRFALDMLGCGPDVGRHTWLKARGPQEMRSILAHVALSQLARDYGEELSKMERNKLLPRSERVPAALEASIAPPYTPVGPHAVPPSAGSTSHQRPALDQEVDHSQVFGIVSPRFGGTELKEPRLTPTPQAPFVVPSQNDDLYAHAHGVTMLLIHAWEAFDQRGGDWSRPDVQEDLSRLRTLAEGYLQRGSTSRTQPPGEVTQ